MYAISHYCSVGSFGHRYYWEILQILYFSLVLAEDLKLGDANIMILIDIRMFSVQLYSVSIYCLSYYMSITLSWAQGNKKMK